MGKPSLSSPREAMILELQQVSKRFGELAAVRDLSFSVEQGEFFGLAGPNGAGKTTLFNVISGESPGTGRVLFDRANIMGLKPHQICHRGIARTFQIPRLFGTMTVEQNVRVGARFGSLGKRGERQTAARCIALVGLLGRESRVTEHIDLFDKKLTMLAAALATGPRLLLLDEPIGGLSPAEIEQFVALIQKVNCKLGVTIIMIEHLMGVLMKICRRIMIINNGEKICIGPPEAIARDCNVKEIYLGTDYA